MRCFGVEAGVYGAVDGEFLLDLQYCGEPFGHPGPHHRVGRRGALIAPGLADEPDGLADQEHMLARWMVQDGCHQGVSSSCVGLAGVDGDEFERADQSWSAPRIPRWRSGRAALAGTDRGWARSLRPPW
jgi:hypothetical protein